MVVLLFAVALFQPTLPARGATRWWSQRRIRPDFNPRSPHGERRQPHGANAPKFGISTHAPRTGSDGHFTTAIYRECAFQPTLPARGATVSGDVFALFGIFQPTLPARGATPAAACLWARKRISTHAPRTGSDAVHVYPLIRLGHFNPRSPHGERLDCQAFVEYCLRFQPTLPARGATRNLEDWEIRLIISTHAPRTGSDGSPTVDAMKRIAFQPTLPARGATIGVTK